VHDPIFRAEAVAAIDAVDRLDEAITIVSARSVLALSAILILVSGSIPVTVAGRGVFVAGSGTAQVSAPDDGTIQTVDVAVGQTILRGQALARERTPAGQIVALRAPQDGTVVEIAAAATVFVRRGDPIASVAPAGSALRAVVFVPVDTDRHVETGMSASIVPADVPALGGRAVRAQVVSVAPYPASVERIHNALQDDALAAQFSAAVPVREVQLELQRRPDGSLRWNGVVGAASPPAGGTPCTATIEVQQRHPIEIIFSRSQ
jgi:multidrug efflux pump subunit AcrA (membrane-fusion protein)